MAVMKNWLMKIKKIILKKDLKLNFIESKIQSEVVEKEKELPDLITPPSKEINKPQRENKIQREEAIRLKDMNVRKLKSIEQINKDYVRFMNVPKRTNRT